MNPRRLLGLVLFGSLAFLIGRDLWEKWRSLEAIFLVPLFLMLVFCFLRFVFVQVTPSRPANVEAK
jgi:hypothetical protein